MQSFGLTKKSLAAIAGLIALAVIWRLVNHEYGLAYNLELVTAVSVIAVLRFGWKAGIVVPLATMAVSDAILGTSPIIIFTWSSFALIGLAAVILRRLEGRRQILNGAGFALVSSTFFFLATNFGVWAQGYYPPTLDGLLLSYEMGIPFYRNMLIGNLILVPAAVAAWQFVRHYQLASVNADETAK